MAKNNNLKDYLTDLYEGIATKKTNPSRNPQDFRQEIESIETGINTSDATATASDILKGKTAYVKDEKVTGSIETYDYSVDEGGDSQDLIEALCNDTLTSYSNSNITKIKDYLFKGNTKLESVDFPNVTSVGERAFQECSKLTNINFPNVTSLGENAFYVCKDLKYVNIPNVTSILNYTFRECSALQSINLPKVTSIGMQSFYYCTNLTDIYLGANQLVTLNNANSFWSIKAGSKVHVRSEYANQYADATNWSSLIADGKIVIVGDYSD